MNNNRKIIKEDVISVLLSLLDMGAGLPIPLKNKKLLKPIVKDYKSLNANFRSLFPSLTGPDQRKQHKELQKTLDKFGVDMKTFFKLINAAAKKRQNEQYDANTASSVNWSPPQGMKVSQYGNVVNQDPYRTGKMNTVTAGTAPNPLKAAWQIGKGLYTGGKHLYNKLKGESVEEQAWANKDGKPLDFEYDPGKGKLKEQSDYEIVFNDPSNNINTDTLNVDNDLDDKVIDNWGPNEPCPDDQPSCYVSWEDRLKGLIDQYDNIDTTEIDTNNTWDPNKTNFPGDISDLLNISPVSDKDKENMKKLPKIHRSKNESSINEISTKAGLEDIIKGRTTAIEGIKMSKDMAEAIMDWIKSSSFGRKYGKQLLKGRIHALIKPANSWGIERFFKGRRKSSRDLAFEWAKITGKLIEVAINEQVKLSSQGIWKDTKKYKIQRPPRNFAKKAKMGAMIHFTGHKSGAKGETWSKVFRDEWMAIYGEGVKGDILSSKDLDKKLEKHARVQIKEQSQFFGPGKTPPPPREISHYILGVPMYDETPEEVNARRNRIKQKEIEQNRITDLKDLLGGSWGPFMKKGSWADKINQAINVGELDPSREDWDDHATQWQNHVTDMESGIDPTVYTLGKDPIEEGVPFPQTEPNEFAFFDFKKWAYKNRGKLKKELLKHKDNPGKLWNKLSDIWAEWAKRTNNKDFSRITDKQKFGRALAIMLKKENVLFDKNPSPSHKITVKEQNDANVDDRNWFEKIFNFDPKPIGTDSVTTTTSGIPSIVDIWSGDSDANTKTTTWKDGEKIDIDEMIKKELKEQEYSIDKDQFNMYLDQNPNIKKKDLKKVFNQFQVAPSDTLMINQGYNDMNLRSQGNFDVTKMIAQNKQGYNDGQGVNVTYDDRVNYSPDGQGNFPFTSIQNKKGNKIGFTHSKKNPTSNVSEMINRIIKEEYLNILKEQMTPSQVKFLSGQLKLKKGDKITYDQHFQFGKVSKNVTAKVIAVNGHTVFLDKGADIDLRQDPIKKVNNKVIK